MWGVFGLSWNVWKVIIVKACVSFDNIMHSLFVCYIAVKCWLMVCVVYLEKKRVEDTSGKTSIYFLFQGKVCCVKRNWKWVMSGFLDVFIYHFFSCERVTILMCLIYDLWTLWSHRLMVTLCDLYFNRSVFGFC